MQVDLIIITFYTKVNKNIVELKLQKNLRSRCRAGINYWNNNCCVILYKLIVIGNYTFSIRIPMPQHSPTICHFYSTSGNLDRKK